MTSSVRAEDGQVYLVTISNDRYPALGAAGEVPYAVSDAIAVARRLRDRCRIVTDDRMLMFDPQSLDPHRRPTRDNIVSELPEFLAVPHPADTVIVYVSLRGVRIANSGTGRFEGFLLPADVDPVRLPETGLSLTWLKDQLLNSAAENVVLFLDAGHAAMVGDRTENQYASLSADDVGRLFDGRVSSRSDRKLYTIVSCGDDQQSVAWPEKRQSVFAYWLCQGLDGAADDNGNAIVSLDELCGFLEREIPLTAGRLSPAVDTPEQTPERFLLGSDHSNLELFPMRAEPATASLKRMAELVDSLLRNHLVADAAGESPRITVLEFATIADTGNATTELRGALGSFGAISRDSIERDLERFNARRRQSADYQLVSATAVQPLLKGVSTGDVMTSKINAAKSAVDALVFGTMIRLGNSPHQAGPDRLLFEVRLMGLQQQIDRAPRSIGRISSTILVDQELESLLNNFMPPPNVPQKNRSEQSIQKPSESSAENSEDVPARPPAEGPAVENSRPDHAPKDNSDGPPRSDTEKDIVPDTESHRSSHTSNPGFDLANIADLLIAPDADDAVNRTGVHGNVDANLKIEVWQGPTRTELRAVSHSASSFEVRNGNLLEIHIENVSGEWLALIALVDGHNVIGRRRMLPSESRYWLIPPRGKGVIDQWLTGTPKYSGPTGSEQQQIGGRQFVVVDAPRSVAHQQRFTAELGELRFMLYDTRVVPADSISMGSDGLPSVGIGEGTNRTNQFPVYRDRKIDISNPLGVKVLNYFSDTASSSAD